MWESQREKERKSFTEIVRAKGLNRRSAAAAFRSRRQEPPPSRLARCHVTVHRGPRASLENTRSKPPGRAIARWRASSFRALAPPPPHLPKRNLARPPPTTTETIPKKEHKRNSPTVSKRARQQGNTVFVSLRRIRRGRQRKHERASPRSPATPSSDVTARINGQRSATARCELFGGSHDVFAAHGRDAKTHVRSVS